MPSNFTFLETRFSEIASHAIQAEKLAYTAPRASCFATQFTLEQAIY